MHVGLIAILAVVRKVLCIIAIHPVLQSAVLLFGILKAISERPESKLTTGLRWTPLVVGIRFNVRAEILYAKQRPVRSRASVAKSIC